MNSHRRVLYVTESYTTHDRRFLQAISKQAEKVWFAYMDGSKEIDKLILPETVSVWPGLHKPIDKWQEMINRHGINVVHAGPLNSVLPKIASHIDCPLVGMSWGSDILFHASGDIDEREQLIQNLNKVNALIVDCKAVVDKLRQWMPNFSIPCIQFPWGIELERFRTLPEDSSSFLRERLGWEGKTVIISTRSWSLLHGIPMLVKAFAILLEQMPDARLILIGSGPLKSEIFNQIRELKLEDKIHFPGHLEEDEMPLWYCAADIYISTSLSDGSSISLLEAMACGLPVIAHREHGNLEWVTDRENGWLIDCHRPEEIRDIILQSVREKVLLEDMRQLNRKKILKVNILSR